MTLEALGFLVGIAGTLIAAVVAYISKDDDEAKQPEYPTRNDARYFIDYNDRPNWNPPMNNPTVPTIPVSATTQPMPYYPWGPAAYIGAIAATPTVSAVPTYSNMPVYNTGVSYYSTGGPQWDPPIANYGVGNDIRPSPTGAPPGWSQPQFAPPSAYW